jgi:hypothetical protein
MEYNKGTGGAWVDADKLSDGVKVKQVSECIKQESRFKNKDGEPKTENVAKVRVQGDQQTYNMRLNWTTVYGLIDAFGKESKEWIEKVLTVKMLDALVGDKMQTIIYLIPEGFELGKNEDKKMEIRKIGGAGDVVPEDKIDYPTEDINPDDIPF